VLGLLGIVGGRYARRNGQLQSRGAKHAALVVINIPAVAVWLGPGIFMVADEAG
jgi:hypothetical protein